MEDEYGIQGRFICALLNCSHQHRGRTPWLVMGKTMLILLIAAAVLLSFVVELAIEAIRENREELES